MIVTVFHFIPNPPIFVPPSPVPRPPSIDCFLPSADCYLLFVFYLLLVCKSAAFFSSSLVVGRWPFSVLSSSVCRLPSSSLSVHRQLFSSPPSVFLWLFLCSNNVEQNQHNGVCLYWLESQVH